MRLSLLLFVCSALCSSILRAGPVLIYSNFDTDFGYNSQSGLNIGDGVAVPFTVPALAPPAGYAYALNDIQFAASTSNTSDSVTVALYDSIANAPGSQLASVDTALGSDPAVVTVDPAVQPILSPNTQYWVVLSSLNSGEATWYQSNTQSGVAELSGSWANFSYSQGAVEVDATLVSAPEPGTFLILAALFPGIVLLARRRSGGHTLLA